MDRRAVCGSAAFLTVVVHALLMLAGCSDLGRDHTQANLARSKQDLTQTTPLARDVVFVIDGDGESIGGQCVRFHGCPSDITCKAGEKDVDESSDPTGCCACAGTAVFSAEIEGVARALEKLPRDGTVEVSVLVSSWGVSDGEVYKGPRTILDNVLWMNPDEAVDGGTADDGGTSELRGKVAEYIAKVRAFTTEDLQVQNDNDCTFPRDPTGAPVDCVPPAFMDWGVWEASRHLNHDNVKGALCVAYGGRWSAPHDHLPHDQWYSARLSGFSEPVPGNQIPSFAQTLTDSINAQRLSELTVVKIPSHNIFNAVGLWDSPLIGQYLYSLTGRLSEPGLVSIQLNCPPGDPAYEADRLVDSFSVGLYPTVTENGQVRSSTLAEHAAKISSTLREHYYAQACHKTNVNDWQACISSYPENIESIGNLIWIETYGFDRVLRACDLTIDMSTSPGLRLSAYTAPRDDANGRLPVDDQAVSKAVALSWAGVDLPRWAPVLAPVKGRWAIAGVPGDFPAPAEVRDAVADCLSPHPTVRAIEVNQSIQAWDNHVPLIARKPTAVRVFMESDPLRQGELSPLAGA